MSDKELIIELPRRAQVIVVLPRSDGLPPERVEVRTPAAIRLADVDGTDRPDNSEENRRNEPKIVITIKYTN